jgi:nitrate reductase gamma subunit
MNAVYALLAVAVLIGAAWAGVSGAGLQGTFGILIPSLALLTFILGMIYRVLKWARSPVPFRIPTTCGQQKSLAWIKSSPLESPHTTAGVLGRMALEILVFRSLFRNTKMGLKNQKLYYGDNQFLWLGALAFHYSFLIILLRHFRFFTEPVAPFVSLLQGADGFFQLGVPELYLTDAIIVLALGYLFFRRVVSPQLRYISLPADYFALFLLLAVAGSGILMRYFFKVDLKGVKELTLGLLSLNPSLPQGIGAIFYVHLFLVSALLAYFPFSKLSHLAGVFLSPTRNLANDNRMRRHLNPWDYPVKVHTYEEWEDDFREKMRVAGLPLEKE